MDLGANGHADMKIKNQDFYIRIDVHRDGSAKLRGGLA
jgi:hypothetical protein